MKKLLLFFCLLAMMIPAKAQNNDRLKYIREKYAEAHNRIVEITKYEKEELAFKNSTTRTRYQNWSAVGPCH